MLEFTVVASFGCENLNQEETTHQKNIDDVLDNIDIIGTNSVPKQSQITSQIFCNDPSVTIERRPIRVVPKRNHATN